MGEGDKLHELTNAELDRRAQFGDKRARAVLRKRTAAVQKAAEEKRIRERAQMAEIAVAEQLRRYVQEKKREGDARAYYETLPFEDLLRIYCADVAKPLDYPVLLFNEIAKRMRHMSAQQLSAAENAAPTQVRAVIQRIRLGRQRRKNRSAPRQLPGRANTEPDWWRERGE